MRFRIERKKFLDSLQVVQSGVGSQRDNVILGNILLKSKDNKLTLTTTDLEIGIQTTLDIEGKTEGSITVPAKTLNEIIREIDKDIIDIEIDNKNRLSISTNKSLFYLNGSPGELFPLFPTLPKQKNLSLSSSLLIKIIKKVIFAVAIDHPKYVLNGICFLLKNNELVAVAIDGCRLALVKKEIYKKKNEKDEYEVIIPIKILKEISRIFKEDESIDLFITQNQIGIKNKKTTIISKLIIGKFPDYNLMIPKEKNNIKLKKKEFLDATRRVAIVTLDKNNIVDIHLNKNSLLITANSPEIGEAKEEIKIAYQGIKTKISFNPKYLIEALINIEEEEIIASFGNPDDPVVLKTLDNNQTNVIMPKKCND